MIAGWECSCCWTDLDISHQVEVCWMWERTLPFSPKAYLPLTLLCVPGKRCMGLTSRKPEGPLRPALPSPAHSTHLSSIGIMRSTQTSWWTAQSAQRTDPAALGLLVHSIRLSSWCFMQIAPTDTWDYHKVIPRVLQRLMLSSAVGIKTV